MWGRQGVRSFLCGSGGSGIELNPVLGEALVCYQRKPGEVTFVVLCCFQEVTKARARSTAGRELALGIAERGDSGYGKLEAAAARWTDSAARARLRFSTAGARVCAL